MLSITLNSLDLTLEVDACGGNTISKPPCPKDHSNLFIKFVKV